MLTPFSAVTAHNCVHFRIPHHPLQTQKQSFDNDEWASMGHHGWGVLYRWREIDNRLQAVRDTSKDSRWFEPGCSQLAKNSASICLRTKKFHESIYGKKKLPHSDRTSNLKIWENYNLSSDVWTKHIIPLRQYRRISFALTSKYSAENCWT